MEKLTYGIWIKGQGWIKGAKGPIAFESKVVAESTAKRLGRLARVEFIDDALVDIELNLLSIEAEQEKKSIWRKYVIPK